MSYIGIYKYYKHVSITELKTLMDTLPKEIRKDIWMLCIGTLSPNMVMSFEQQMYAMRELQYDDPVLFKELLPTLPLEVLLVFFRNAHIRHLISYQQLLDIMTRSRFMILQYYSEESITIYYDVDEVHGIPVSRMRGTRERFYSEGFYSREYIELVDNDHGTFVRLPH